MNIDKHPFTVLIVLCFKQDRRNHVDPVVQCRNNNLSIVFPNNFALVIDCIYQVIGKCVDLLGNTVFITV